MDERVSRVAFTVKDWKRNIIQKKEVFMPIVFALFWIFTALWILWIIVAFVRASYSVGIFLILFVPVFSSNNQHLPHDSTEFSDQGNSSPAGTTTLFSVIVKFSKLW